MFQKVGLINFIQERLLNAKPAPLRFKIQYVSFAYTTLNVILFLFCFVSFSAATRRCNPDYIRGASRF